MGLLGCSKRCLVHCYEVVLYVLARVLIFFIVKRLLGGCYSVAMHCNGRLKNTLLPTI